MPRNATFVWPGVATSGGEEVDAIAIVVNGDRRLSKGRRVSRPIPIERARQERDLDEKKTWAEDEDKEEEQGAEEERAVARLDVVDLDLRPLVEVEEARAPAAAAAEVEQRRDAIVCSGRGTESKSAAAVGEKRTERVSRRALEERRERERERF